MERCIAINQGQMTLAQWDKSHWVLNGSPSAEDMDTLPFVKTKRSVEHPAYWIEGQFHIYINLFDGDYTSLSEEEFVKLKPEQMTILYKQIQALKNAPKEPAPKPRLIIKINRDTPKAQPEVKPEVQPKVQPEAQPKVQPKVQPEVEEKVKLGTKSIPLGSIVKKASSVKCVDAKTFARMGRIPDEDEDEAKTEEAEAEAEVEEVKEVKPVEVKAKRKNATNHKGKFVLDTKTFEGIKSTEELLEDYLNKSTIFTTNLPEPKCLL